MTRMTKNGSTTSALRSAFPFVLALGASIYPLSVLAGPAIVLERDESPALCAAYQKALVDLTRNFNGISRDFLCERPLHSANPQFVKPEWRSGGSELWHTGALRKIDDFRWQRDVDPFLFFRVDKRPNWKGTDTDKAEARRGYLNDRKARQSAGHLLAAIDIDNDGSAEAIYFDQACHSIYGSVLLVLDSNRARIDQKKTRPLLVHPDWKALKAQGASRNSAVDPANAAALLNAFYGVFRFEGVTYFDYAWYPADEIASNADSKDVSTTIHVFTNNKSKTAEMCRLKLNIYSN